MLKSYISSLKPSCPNAYKCLLHLIERSTERNADETFTILAKDESRGDEDARLVQDGFCERFGRETFIRDSAPASS